MLASLLQFRPLGRTKVARATEAILLYLDPGSRFENLDRHRCALGAAYRPACGP